MTNDLIIDPDMILIISCSNTSCPAVEIISLTDKTEAKKLYRTVMPKLARTRLISMRLSYLFIDSHQSRQSCIILANVTSKCRYDNRFDYVIVAHVQILSS